MISPFARSVLRPALLGGLVLLGVLAQEPAPAPPPAPPPAPAPGPAPTSPGDPPPAVPGPGKSAPISKETLNLLLRRAEQNVIRHGLSLDPKFLQYALDDYRSATTSLPADADPGQLFDAWFGIAFVLARAELPADSPAAEPRAKEAFEALDRASKVRPAFAGLWVVEGMLREQRGDLQPAMDHITRGLVDLEGYKGLQPWQVYQFQFFGLLARGRAFLNSDRNNEVLAMKDFEKVAALAEEALKDHMAPRPNYLRRTALTALASAYQRLDYDDKAIKIIEELMKEDPANYIHPYNMALMMVFRMRYPEAVSYYRRAAELNRFIPTPHLKIAYILLEFPEHDREPDLAEAEREGEIYLRLVGGSSDAEYCSLRGEAAFLRKDMKEAERWFRQALRFDDGCRTAISRMLHILGMREDREKVRMEIEDLKKRMETNSSGERREKMAPKRAKMTFC